LAEIKREELKTQNAKTRLLRKYNIETEDLDQVIEELQQKYWQRLSDGLHTESNKISTVKMKCLEQIARLSTSFSGREILK
jgi:predicted DNA-binding protein (UPF0278 family)